MIEKNFPYLIFFGPAGAGKGTQVKLLEEKYGYRVVEAGSLIRARIKKGDELGKKFEEITKSGRRLSDDDITSLLREELQTLDSSTPVIFDGYPRTPVQSERLWDICTGLACPEIKVVSIEVSRDEAMRRLLTRSMCEKGHIFTTRDITKCPEDGSPVTARYDDSEESIRNRLDWYDNEIVPSIEYFNGKVEIVKINGEQSVEEVHAEIIGKLGI